MDKNIYTDVERQEAQIAEQKEREVLTKMRDESIRKFKEKFPNRGKIESVDFFL